MRAALPLCKSRENSIEQQNRKGHEKRDQFLVSKMDFNVQISQRNKNILPIDPFFSNWVTFIKKE